MALYLGRSSPRPWGCFFVTVAGAFRIFGVPSSPRPKVGVFSNQVDVMRPSGLPTPVGVFPHRYPKPSCRHQQSSPRPWGVSSHAAALTSLQGRASFHANAGVFDALVYPPAITLRVFPTPVRCFQAHWLPPQTPRLPTPVGCFLMTASLMAPGRVFPRPWGVSLLHENNSSSSSLPTPVGVFPTSSTPCIQYKDFIPTPRPWGIQCFPTPGRHC